MTDVIKILNFWDMIVQVYEGVLVLGRWHQQTIKAIDRCCLTTRDPPINNNNILFPTEVSLPHVEQVLFATSLMSFWMTCVFEF